LVSVAANYIVITSPAVARYQKVRILKKYDQRNPFDDGLFGLFSCHSSIALFSVLIAISCRGVYMWRYVQDAGKSLGQIVDIPPILLILFRRIVCSLMAKNPWAQGTGRLKNDDVFHLMGDDLRVLSILLGTKKFILGDEPTEVDCAVFGMLSQVIWCAPGSPYERMLNGEFNEHLWRKIY